MLLLSHHQLWLPPENFTTTTLNQKGKKYV